MADSIVAQHNLTRNALPSFQAASRLINYAPKPLTFLIALAAFALSFMPLQEIVLSYTLPLDLAWVWPLPINFILIIFSLTVVRVSVYSERTML